ncbi:sensor histidine kinase [Flavobacterium sp. JP2137]|uniref:sensor histidine kinase n=1 Tax=Flavobacterium sp. JP2137 TaxID=3414510 RepID=UPI003D2F9CC8
MKISLKNYTLKYLSIAVLLVIAVWAALFYALILDELYDNTDDGLKDLKIQIIRKAYIDDSILQISEFDFNQFRIQQVVASEFKEGNFFRNEQFYMEYDNDMEPYRILETYFTDINGNTQKLEIRTSTVEEDDFGEDLLFALVFLYIFLVVSIVLIHNVVLKRVWKPFYSTLNNLERYEFGQGDKSQRNPTQIREFKLLDQKINQMIERNERVFTQQKQFIENAAHELQTPLAIAIHKLDLLIESEGVSEVNAQEISQTKEVLLRLVKLNKSLLMFSRIENNQFGEREAVVLNPIVKGILDDFSDTLAFKGIRVDYSDVGLFKTNIIPDLAYVLISNLLTNAIKYNKAAGQLHIEVTEVALRIKNSSVDDIPLNTDLVFNRFYKTNQDFTSTGLGLSIVKTIVENHSDLNIDYVFKDGNHIFSLTVRNS